MLLHHRQTSRRRVPFDGVAYKTSRKIQKPFGMNRRVMSAEIPAQKHAHVPYHGAQ